MLATWRYDPTASRRDLRLDLLRGLCLVKMVFNHLWHTPVHAVQNWLGFISAAEGFFFISGVVVGIVHGRRARQQGLAPVTGRVLTRSTHLYAANLALLVFFLALETGGLLGGNSFSRLWGEAGFGWAGLFTLNQPYHLHVLPRYVVFLAATPAALWCLTRGRTSWLLAATAGIYLAGQLLGGKPRLPWLESEGYLAFPVLTWQLTFFLGTACGYHRRRLARWWRRLPPGPLALGLGAASLGFVWLHRAAMTGGLPLGREEIETWFGRTGLGPARLVNLAVAFAFIFFSVDRCWRPIHRLLGPLLIPIGQHSLYVFLVHIPLVWLGMAALPPVAAELTRLPWALLAVDLAALTGIWLLVRRRVLFGFLPN